MSKCFHASAGAAASSSTVLMQESDETCCRVRVGVKTPQMSLEYGSTIYKLGINDINASECLMLCSHGHAMLVPVFEGVDSLAVSYHHTSARCRRRSSDLLLSLSCALIDREYNDQQQW